MAVPSGYNGQQGSFAGRIVACAPRICRLRHAAACAILAAAAALLASCAAGYQSAPPGGPPDSTAPAIEAFTPASGTVNFRERTVSITFSEYVNESNVPASVVITPIPADPPEYDWSGRTLEITFAKPLVDNRTYTITLGSAITDLSNNRLGRPFSLRFSTGDIIDSGRVQGTVLGRAAGKAYIFAYLIGPDTAAFNARFRPDSVRPDFIAPIGDDGGFSLEGLPAGSFRYFVVVDAAADQLFTPGEDAYGVATDDVTLASQTAPVSGIALRLRAAPDDLAPPALYSARSLSPRSTELKFSEPLRPADLVPERFSLAADGASSRPLAVWSSRQAPLVVRLEHSPLAPGQATVSALGVRDTTGNIIPDSAARAEFTVVAVPDSVAPRLLQPRADTVSQTVITFADSLILGFDEAVELDPAAAAAALGIRDSSTGGARMALRLARISPAEFVARAADTSGVTNGRLEINLGAFRDNTGNRTDTVLRIPVFVAPRKLNGTLQGSITDSAAPSAPHVVTARLLPSGPTFTLSGLRSGAWEFSEIPEGEYEVSAFRDTDGDAQYDHGSLLPYRTAEPYTLWRGSVRVRPRWVTNRVDMRIE